MQPKPPLTASQKIQMWEAAWTRYVRALELRDERESHPDGRARYAARRSVRAARRNLETVCAEIGETCPAFAGLLLPARPRQG